MSRAHLSPCLVQKEAVVSPQEEFGCLIVHSVIPGSSDVARVRKHADPRIRMRGSDQTWVSRDDVGVTYDEQSLGGGCSERLGRGWGAWPLDDGTDSRWVVSGVDGFGNDVEGIGAPLERVTVTCGYGGGQGGPGFLAKQILTHPSRDDTPKRTRLCCVDPQQQLGAEREADAVEGTLGQTRECEFDDVRVLGGIVESTFTAVPRQVDEFDATPRVAETAEQA